MRAFIIVIAAVLAAGGAAGQTTRAASSAIVRVKAHYEASAPKPGVNSLQPSLLPKYAGNATPIDTLVDVEWAPPATASRSDFVVTLDFRTAAQPAQVRRLVMAYPQPVSGRKTSTFRVQGTSAEAGNPLVAWRAYLVQDGRTLAEQRSGTWK